jgi:hypothetical protein
MSFVLWPVRCRISRCGRLALFIAVVTELRTVYTVAPLPAPSAANRFLNSSFIASSQTPPMHLDRNRTAGHPSPLSFRLHRPMPPG